MATTATDNLEALASERLHKLSVPRLAFTGAVAAAALFLLCWAAAALVPDARATHMYIQLLTSAEVASSIALAEGLGWSLAFGLIAGGLVALAYNASARLFGR